MSQETTTRRLRPAGKIPFGMIQNRVYSADEVPNGLDCQCTCPGCRGQLIARNGGKVRIHHFAHHVAAVCSGGLETGIHLRAKQLIVEHLTLLLPAWNGWDQMPNPPQARDLNGKIHSGSPVQWPPCQVDLLEAAAEVRLGDYRPDVLAKDHMGELLIEIRVSHAVDDLKLWRVRADGRRMMEIDLSRVTLHQAGKTFSHCVLSDPGNRLWVSNVDIAESWRASRDELMTRVRRVDDDIRAVRAGQEQKAKAPRATGVYMARDVAAKELNARSRAVRLDQMDLDDGRIRPLLPIERVSDPLVGRRLWHLGHGNGTILERAVRMNAIYKVRFDKGLCRLICLDPSTSDEWRWIDTGNDMLASK